MTDVKSHLPPTLIALARLARTRLTLAGWYDSAEARLRRETLRRLREQPPAPASGRRVLVFSFRGWPAHAAWDAVLAHALRLRGAEVHAFYCGGRLPACEVNFRQADPRVVCAECRSYPHALVSGLGLPHSSLRDYVSAAEAASISEAVARLRDDELETFEFDGQPIGQLVQNSVLWILRRSEIELPRDGELYRAFLVSGAEIARLAPRLLSAVQPAAVLEVNGLFFAEQILNRFVPAGCDVITYEAGWRSNTLGFDRWGPNGFADLDDAWGQWAETPLTPEEDRTLDDWIAARAGGRMERDHYVRFEQSEADAVAALGFDPKRPTAVLFTNLVWDTAVLGRDTGFASIRAWIDTTVGAFRARPEWQLAIRIHPAEELRPSQPSREKLSDYLGEHRLPPNVKVIGSRDPCNSYALMRAAAAVLVYTSTTGLEAALHGRPVVVAARVYYANRGFTENPGAPGAYREALHRLMDGAPGVPLEAVTRARRFAYLLLFRFLRQIPVVHQRPSGLPLLEPSGAARLQPGGSPELDSLLAAILNQTDLVPAP